jgi:hypothetical protein
LVSIIFQKEVVERELVLTVTLPAHDEHAPARHE